MTHTNTKSQDVTSDAVIKDVISRLYDNTDMKYLVSHDRIQMAKLSACLDEMRVYLQLMQKVVSCETIYVLARTLLRLYTPDQISNFYIAERVESEIDVLYKIYSMNNSIRFDVTVERDETCFHTGILIDIPLQIIRERCVLLEIKFKTRIQTFWKSVESKSKNQELEVCIIYHNDFYYSVMRTSDAI